MRPSPLPAAPPPSRPEPTRAEAPSYPSAATAPGRPPRRRPGPRPAPSPHPTPSGPRSSRCPQAAARHAGGPHQQPAPAADPLRTTVRRVKIYAPVVLLLAVVLAVVQLVRPLPAPRLALSAKASYTFDGGAPTLPWPKEGQGFMAAAEPRHRRHLRRAEAHRHRQRRQDHDGVRDPQEPPPQAEGKGSDDRRRQDRRGRRPQGVRGRVHGQHVEGGRQDLRVRRPRRDHDPVRQQRRAPARALGHRR